MGVNLMVFVLGKIQILKILVSNRDFGKYQCRMRAGTGFIFFFCLSEHKSHVSHFGSGHRANRQKPTNSTFSRFLIINKCSSCLEKGL